MPDMRTVDQEVERLLLQVQPLPSISVSLLDATGCFLAVDATSRRPDQFGAVVLTSGSLVATRQLAMLAAAGVSAVEVAPRPRVVVQTVGEGTEATALVLASACQEAGAQVYRVGSASRRSLHESVEDQLVRADLMLLVGGEDGSGYNDLDEALRSIGTIEYSHVAMAPGGIHGFARLGEEGTLAMVLPGSALAAYAHFEVFVRPILRVLAADPEPFRPTVRAEVDTLWDSPAGAQEFRFGRLEIIDQSYVFTPTAATTPLEVLAESSALASISPEVESVRRGAAVLAIPLEVVRA